MHRLLPVGGICRTVDGSNARQSGMTFEWSTVEKFRRVKNRRFGRRKPFGSSPCPETHPVILEPGGSALPGA